MVFNNLKMIVASDSSGAIGCNNKLMWHLPEDLKYFKEQTNNSNVIMGRKTFESLDMPDGLPNRFNFVITNNKDKVKHTSNNVLFVSLKEMKYLIGFNPLETFWVIGGSQIYHELIDNVSELHHTLVYPEVIKKVTGNPEDITYLTDKTRLSMFNDFDVESLTKYDDFKIIVRSRYKNL